MTDFLSPPSRHEPESHRRGSDKLARIPVKVQAGVDAPRKPPWIRVKLESGESVNRVRRLLRERGLHTVCEEAACPNLGECFGHGTATFMILGDLCTRRCPFCDVAHGRPLPPNAEEPGRLAEAVRALGLNYVVVTSVDRDDLRDGGAGHFAACVAALRERAPEVKIEILTPDFRGRLEAALTALAENPPDVFNHNLETVPRLYRAVRPGADYAASLELLRRFRVAHPSIPSKSGLMLGVGETLEEVEQAMADLRQAGCAMLTIGQYLRPSPAHLPVSRYASPEEFAALEESAYRLGFTHVASGPLVRSSYHADQQANSIFHSS